MIATENLLRVFVDVADTLVDDYDLLDFLHDLADHAASLASATTVGLVLADDQGNLQFMAASDDGAKAMELIQLQENEGPCLDCFRRASPVSVVDLRQSRGRWPTFSRLALERGVMAAHAFPMRLRQQTIGALNLFSDDPHEFSAEESGAVQALADIATIGILQERAISAADLLTSQLQYALNSRVTIEQAKGVAAQSLGIDVEAAFRLMRGSARSQSRRLLDVADDVVGGRVNPADWRG